VYIGITILHRGARHLNKIQSIQYAKISAPDDDWPGGAAAQSDNKTVSVLLLPLLLLYVHIIVYVRRTTGKTAEVQQLVHIIIMRIRSRGWTMRRDRCPLCMIYLRPGGGGLSHCPTVSACVCVRACAYIPCRYTLYRVVTAICAYIRRQFCIRGAHRF